MLLPRSFNIPTCIAHVRVTTMRGSTTSSPENKRRWAYDSVYQPSSVSELWAECNPNRRPLLRVVEIDDCRDTWHDV